MKTDQAKDVQARRVITGTLFRTRGRGVRFGAKPPQAKPESVRRPAKVATLLALAHKIQDAIDRGAVADRATVARRLGFTRARVTQLLDLTLLAPDVQERVLELEAVDGAEPMSETDLRSLVRAESWTRQREKWNVSCPSAGSNPCSRRGSLR